MSVTAARTVANLGNMLCSEGSFPMTDKPPSIIENSETPPSSSVAYAQILNLQQELLRLQAEVDG